MEFGDKVKNAKFIKAREWREQKTNLNFRVTSMRLRISFSTLLQFMCSKTGFSAPVSEAEN